MPSFIELPGFEEPTINQDLINPYELKSYQEIYGDLAQKLYLLSSDSDLDLSINSSIESNEYDKILYKIKTLLQPMPEEPVRDVSLWNRFFHRVPAIPVEVYEKRYQLEQVLLEIKLAVNPAVQYAVCNNIPIFERPDFIAKQLLHRGIADQHRYIEQLYDQEIIGVERANHMLGDLERMLSERDRKEALPIVVIQNNAARFYALKYPHHTDEMIIAMVALECALASLVSLNRDLYWDLYRFPSQKFSTTGLQLVCNKSDFIPIQHYTNRDHRYLSLVEKTKELMSCFHQKSSFFLKTTEALELFIEIDALEAILHEKRGEGDIIPPYDPYLDCFESAMSRTRLHPKPLRLDPDFCGQINSVLESLPRETRLFEQSEELDATEKDWVFCSRGEP